MTMKIENEEVCLCKANTNRIELTKKTTENNNSNNNNRNENKFSD